MSFLQYFEKRRKTYPQSIKGRFRHIKNNITWIGLIIYLGLPFLRWDRGAALSNQGVLIDIVHSRAYFFFIEMWPEEVYYLAGILIFAAVLLFFVTSLFGRVWCGYSCPQTVWVDLFVMVERLFQGDRNRRIQLDRKGFSFSNIWRKAATHTVWILIGLITGFAFACYFNDAFLLIHQLINFEISFNVWCWIFGIAGSTYIMAGFAREQVCNYMCPYSRFQSAMFDQDTLIISYDLNRGEPRGKHKQGVSFDNRGHCIDCKQCVVVCPQGIDIRDGLQMECIACGLCVDACDNVMEKIGLPKGLVRYDTIRNIENSDKSIKTAFKILRPRTFYYLAILVIVGGVILYNLTFKPTLVLNVISDRNPMFVMLSDGTIRNGYTIKINNKTHENRVYNIKILGIKDIHLKTVGTSDLNVNNLSVEPDDVGSFKVFAGTKEDNLDISGKTKIQIIISDNKTGEIAVKNSIFISK